MVELLLKIRVAIERVFTTIIWLDLTPFINDLSLVVKVLLDCLVKRGYPCLVIISLGIKIGNTGDSNP